MTTLRRRLSLILLTALVISSGCMGALVGDEPLSFTSTEATIADDALSGTGYEHDDTQKLEFNRTFEVGGQSRQVEATSWVTTYTKSAKIPGVGEQQAAAVALLSTPEVNVLGQSFNPLSEMSNADLIERVLAGSGAVRNVEKVGSRTVTILGEETEVAKFSATMEVDGMQVDSYVHIGRVTHDGDILLVVGMYPKQLSEEEPTVFELLEAVEH